MEHDSSTSQATSGARQAERSHPPPGQQPLTSSPTRVRGGEPEAQGLTQCEQDELTAQRLQNEELEQGRARRAAQEEHGGRDEGPPQQPREPHEGPRPAGQNAAARPPRMQVPMIGQVHATIVQAKLTRTHSFYGMSRMDPYVKLRFGHNSFVTFTSLNGDKEPRWNQTLVCPFAQGLDRIHIEIFDEKTFSTDKVIGTAEIRLPETIFSGSTVDDWYPIDGDQGEGSEGLINVVLSYREVPAPQMNPFYYQATMPAMMQAMPPPAPPVITEEAVNSLKELFPDYDVEVIRSVLVNSGGNTDVAANALLQMAQ